jgi:drug/metabolite transporter (DMT)-like permease
MSNAKLRGYLSIILVMIIWGSSFTITKVIVREVPPILFAFIRHVIACIVLFPFFVKIWDKETKSVIRKSDYLILVWMGVFGIALYYIAFNFSMKLTSASIGALIQGFMPIVIAVMGLFFLKESLNKWQIFGLILAFLGIVLVGFLNIGHTEENNNLGGNLLMFTAICSWAIYTILSRKLEHIHPIIITSISTFFGTILLVGPSLLENDHWNLTFSMKAWFGVVFMGTLNSAVCYLLYNKAVKSLPVVQVGNFLNLDPIIGVIIAVIFLNEQMNIWQLIGGTLVLTGIAISSIKNGH